MPRPISAYLTTSLEAVFLRQANELRSAEGGERRRTDRQRDVQPSRDALMGRTSKESRARSRSW